MLYLPILSSLGFPFYTSCILYIQHIVSVIRSLEALPFIRDKRSLCQFFSRLHMHKKKGSKILFNRESLFAQLCQSSDICIYLFSRFWRFKIKRSPHHVRLLHYPCSKTDLKKGTKKKPCQSPSSVLGSRDCLRAFPVFPSSRSLGPTWQSRQP